MNTKKVGALFLIGCFFVFSFLQTSETKKVTDRQETWFDPYIYSPEQLKKLNDQFQHDRDAASEIVISTLEELTSIKKCLLKDAAAPADVSIVDQQKNILMERLEQIRTKTDDWGVGEWWGLDLFCHKVKKEQWTFYFMLQKLRALNAIELHVQERMTCAIAREKTRNNNYVTVGCDVSADCFSRWKYRAIDAYTHEVIEQVEQDLLSCGKSHMQDTKESLETFYEGLAPLTKELIEKIAKVRLEPSYLENNLDMLKCLNDQVSVMELDCNDSIVSMHL